MPLMRALVLNYQDDPHARATKDEYLFGPDLLVAPVIDAGTQRAVYLPAGDWVDYWTGKPFAGGQTVVADAPVDSIPVWVRAGAVIPKIPEDIMTLVPPSESHNTTVKSLDNRRVYEVIGGAGETHLTDFEGRALTRTANSLRIQGEAARVIVRWRFGSVASATVNGAPAQVQLDGLDGPYVEFDHTAASVVEWQEGPPSPPAAPTQIEPAPAPVSAPPAPAARLRTAPASGSGVVASPAQVPSAAPESTIPSAKLTVKTASRSSASSTAHHTRSRRCRHRPCAAAKPSTASKQSQ
jgi:hypothetical protein